MSHAPDARERPLGILAGRGSLPLQVARAARSSGRDVHVVTLAGFADDALRDFPCTVAGIGQFGRIVGAFKGAGCEEIVIIGGAQRPQFRNLRIDLGTVANLPRLLALTVGGDNSLLSALIAIFESKGLRVVGAHEIAPELLVAEGSMGAHGPSERDRADIRVGFEVLKALSTHDVGQAAVVARGHVIAVEAAEGTDAMLERCAGLKKWGFRRGGPRAGVLVKCAKLGQERRVDLPSIGPETVRRAARARLAGIAVAAGDVLVADWDETARLADRHRLFVIGTTPPWAGPGGGGPRP